MRRPRLPPRLPRAILARRMTSRRSRATRRRRGRSSRRRRGRVRDARAWRFAGGGVRDAARKSRRGARSRTPGCFFWNEETAKCRGDDDTETRENVQRERRVFRVARCEAACALSAAPRRATQQTYEHSVALDVGSPRRSEYRRSRVSRADTHFASYPESTSSDRSRCVVTTPYLDGDT